MKRETAILAFGGMFIWSYLLNHFEHPELTMWVALWYLAIVAFCNFGQGHKS